MMHLSRRRIAGGLAAALATAGLLGVATVAAPGTAELPGWTYTVLAVALTTAAVAAALVATVWTVRTLQPHARAIVRALRARRIRRRARAARRAPRPASPGTKQRRSALVFVTVVVGVVLAVCVVTVVINYAHGMDVSQANGETGWRAWLYPIAADGMMIASSLVLVWQLLTTNATTLLPRISFIVGIGASIGTNVLAALHTGATGHELVERIVVITWPTVALLFTHEMALLFLYYYARQADVFGTQAPSPAIVEAQQAQQAAEQRAAEAEAAAEQARQHAEAELEAAHEQAEQRVTAVRQEVEQQLAELRQQYDSAQDEHRATEADLREKVAKLQVQVERQYEELARAQAELAEIEQTEHDERTAEDYRALQRIINDEVADLRRSGEHGSLTTVMARRHQVSARWVQQHTDAPARRNREEELQLAGAG